MSDCASVAVSTSFGPQSSEAGGTTSLDRATEGGDVDVPREIPDCLRDDLEGPEGSEDVLIGSLLVPVS